MAPLPTNNTGVLFIDYTSGGQQHTAEVRLPAGSGLTEAATAYAAMRDVMKAVLYPDDLIQGGRWRAAGGTVTLPVTGASAAGTGSGTPDNDRKPNFLSFTGRSSDGRRVRFTVFTRAVAPEADGWRDLTPNTSFQAILTALQSADVSARTISGNSPIWHSYVNTGSNSYFQRKERRTSAH